MIHGLPVELAVAEPIAKLALAAGLILPQKPVALAAPVVPDSKPLYGGLPPVLGEQPDIVKPVAPVPNIVTAQSPVWGGLTVAPSPTALVEPGPFVVPMTRP